LSFGEIAIFLLIVLGVLVVTTLVFGGWLLVTVVRLISRGIAGLLGVPNYARPTLASPAILRCPRARCHAENHPSAKYCRRCGANMHAAAQRTPVKVRRAAIF